MPEWPGCLFYFLQIKSEFSNKESWSEPQSAPGLVFADCIELLHLRLQRLTKLILVLSVWWCLCVVLSLVLLEEGVCYDQCLFAELYYLLAFALLHSILQGQISLLLQVFLDFLLLHSSPLWWKGHLFLVLVLEYVVDFQRNCSTSASLALVVGT